MDRLAAEAEADKLRMQSRSEQERREIEDSRFSTTVFFLNYFNKAIFPQA